MTIANTMDRLVKWTEENICSKIKLKVPPEDIEAATDADYEYKEASPACFPIYIPTRDKLPPGADFPIPSVCIRILDGTDYIRNVPMRRRWFERSGSGRSSACRQTWS